MQNQEEFKSMWLQKIEDFWSVRRNAFDYKRHINNPDELFTEVERAIKRTLDNSDTQGDDAERMLNALREDRIYTDAKKNYKQIIRNHNELLNMEKQVRKSDIESKFRFLIFRILTAIAIALVVLGAASVAHKFGIPIPLLRMPV